MIAESTTGSSRDAATNRVLVVNGMMVVPLTEAIARAAGALCYRAGKPACDTIDAVVVATADGASRSTILTGDPGDIRALASVHARSLVLSVTG